MTILSIPPFVFRISSPLRHLQSAVDLAYRDYEVLTEESFVDFDIDLKATDFFRRYCSPKVNLAIDGGFPFEPLPLAQAYPLLEWGMNWCVTATAHHFLMCHSAVLAKNDLALILPAPPGSGKSTLCAALAMSGWRLLSDELALIDPDTLALTPFVRPVSLKNASIAIVAERYPDSVFTPSVRDTVKGTVAHMRAPLASIKAGRQVAQARWLIFPKFIPGAAWHLTPLPKATAMTELASNVFNFRGLGMLAFETLSRLVDSVDCFQLEYSSLADAEEQLGILASQ